MDTTAPRHLVDSIHTSGASAPSSTPLAAVLRFDKGSGLLPAIVQDARSGVVLMLGFMNQEALEATLTSGIVTFFSRTKQRLWTKGETSGNVLRVERILVDCDSDTLLVKVQPAGVVCHTGADTCFNEVNPSLTLSIENPTPVQPPENGAESAHAIESASAQSPFAPQGDDNFLYVLEGIIYERKNAPPETSYTSKLLARGINKVAQKVGEEAVELVIEAKDSNDDLFIGEAADLLFHMLVLLAAKEIPLYRVIAELRHRHHRHHRQEG
jgi:phosphoribosyl-ATP pyrophosphohydrolase/phosphoribosyl-AMP cyclohydrolase